MMSFKQVVFCLSVLLIHNVSYILACDGYAIKDAQITPCEGSRNIISVTDYSMELTKNCTLVPRGCIKVDKEITSFSVEYEVKKDLITFAHGTLEDGCNKIQSISGQMLTMLKSFGIPTSCPIKPDKVCGGSGKVLSVEKFKSRLGLALGKIHGKVTIKTNNGNSCFTFSQRVTHSNVAGASGKTGRQPGRTGRK